jgi:RHS repeat-associated protein
VAEFDPASGDLKKEYLYGANGLIATIATGEGTRYVTADHLGSARILTSASGGVISRHDYEPFGEELFEGMGDRTAAQGYSKPDDTLRQKFTGKERDIETGLDYFLARYYSSAQGRLTSVDPENAGADEDDPQSWNGYAYALNNPLLYIDPDGLDVQVFWNGGGTRTYRDSEFAKYKISLESEGFTLKNGRIYSNGADEDGNPVSTQIGTYVSDMNPLGEGVINEMARRAPALETAVTVMAVAAAAQIAIPTIGLSGATSTAGALNQGRKVLQKIESAIDDIIGGATKGKVSSSRQFHKSGGMNQANKDFDSLIKTADGTKVQTRGAIRTSELPNGTKVTVRPNSTQGSPTLQIKPPRGGGKQIEVRYK